METIAKFSEQGELAGKGPLEKFYMILGGLQAGLIMVRSMSRRIYVIRLSSTDF